MPVEVEIPRVSPTMQDVTVVEWKKNEGDSVSKEEILATVETEKISQDVEAVADGVLYKILVHAGEVAPIDKPLGVIRLSTDTPEDLRQYDSSKDSAAVAVDAKAITAATPAASVRDRKIRISPVARKIAKEKGIDLALLPTGSGPSGRITEQDVLAYWERSGNVTRGPLAEASDKHIPLTDVRRQTIARLRQSRDETIPVTSITEIDLTALLDIYRQIKASWEEKYQVKITLNAFFVKAVALALRQHEMLNSCLVDNEVIVKSAVNIGLAMQVNDGLYVPVIRNSDQLSVPEIARAIAGFVQKIERKSLTMTDMSEGTFTLTNVGPFNVLLSTPVIVYPQVGILGIGTICERPVFQGEAIVKRQLCHLSLTYDHRVVDGVPAALFRQSLQRLLEKPAELLV